MRKIHLLDKATISKIAAGEIIEDPASVVKELLENAIDAKATTITIEIRGNIGDYIKISDNGTGISREDIDYAILHHSTSKLNSQEDIYSIHTLGFRGEALASICHVSKMQIITRTEQDESAMRVFVEEGSIVKREETAGEIGTSILVKNLFYNTPVRKKYLKSDTREFGKILDLVNKISLGTKDISIRLNRDGKNILMKNANLSPINRIYTVLGREIAENLIPISYETENYTLEGFISNNKLFRSTRSNQYLFINGRSVRNIEIAKEIEKAYHTLIPLSRYPVFILDIKLDPILVDVNIHPKKNEVKLSNESGILGSIYPHVARVLNPKRDIASFIEEKEEIKPLTVFEIYDEKNIDKNTENFSETKIDFEKTPYEGIINSDRDYNYFSKVAENEKSYDYTLHDAYKDFEEVESENPSQRKFEKIQGSNFVGILFKTYILMENVADDIVYLIDQHAAHERVLFEKFRESFENEKVASQLLLMPQTLELNPKEMSAVMSNMNFLKRLGFELEDFGSDKILIRQVPIVFDSPARANFIRDIIENLDEIETSYDSNLYKIMKKACKAAVKAGDTLSEREVFSLLGLLKECEVPFTCPHGRPTVIELSRNDLEKIFLRQI
ncbi:DNA mismatch repair protein [Clostridiales bacterium KA00134]|nr:DNA mismatch repair protein [Clostridiales bacterium KA00134]